MHPSGLRRAGEQFDTNHACAPCAAGTWNDHVGHNDAACKACPASKGAVTTNGEPVGAAHASATFIDIVGDDNSSICTKATTPWQSRRRRHHRPSQQGM